MYVQNLHANSHANKGLTGNMSCSIINTFDSLNYTSVYVYNIHCMYSSAENSLFLDSFTAYLFVILPWLTFHLLTNRAFKNFLVNVLLVSASSGLNHWCSLFTYPFVLLSYSFRSYGIIQHECHYMYEKIST